MPLFYLMFFVNEYLKEILNMVYLNVVVIVIIACLRIRGSLVNQLSVIITYFHLHCDLITRHCTLTAHADNISLTLSS